MEIGKQIRSRREEVKMTQQQLADQIYVTRQTISKWELGKSEPDPISRSSLERILAVQLTEGSSSQKAEEADVMKKIQWFAGLLLFGILFLPLRFLWVMIRRYWERPWNRFILIPAVLVFVLWYLHSLKDHVFYFFLAVILLAYLVTSYYFFNDQKMLQDN
ncbi:MULTISPECIES: helix-turn-helix domain-containing protein [Enterococcus]|uniref:HTH cro/C1-type domain-containing protein n=1 Tax=Enterococcus malodoratus ATCC 43197 TaxID=1158601 RepID=R2RBR5_9ENTE|nr:MULTISPECIES: helix-turn-helix transcriptional regulator [Enterococcus]BBM19185.1 hypothetical protein G15_2857 [Enterococcus avium]EOH81135.1 hypothetical protein UAI_01180 [Enterococcus malodoratus ATCC 43197]EOT69645.1 hypothetical protein I585_01112 [Enterococcus malodoratus ATCC 43197]OJG60352.1 hypothetical protein RV07_GL002214 [Enterococcus malodoratus]SES85478.1 Helix-turn-helix [Enterococcus malodoratus]